MPQTLGMRYALAQGTGTSFEPLRKHSWEVTIAGIGGVTEITLAAQKCDTPGYTTGKNSLWHVNERTNYSKRGEAKDLSMTVLDVINPHVLKDLWNYWSKCYNANPTGGVNAFGGSLSGPQMGYASDYKTTITVNQFDVAANPVRSWTCYGAFLLGSPAPGLLDYTGDEALMIDMQWAIDRIAMNPVI